MCGTKQAWQGEIGGFGARDQGHKMLEHPYLVNATGTFGTNWDEIVVGREQRATTLECILTEARPDVNVNWMVKDLSAGGWKLLLSASERDGFSGGASKPSMRLADPNFLLTGNFSLLLQAAKQDHGLYMCLIEHERKTIKQKVILLAILTVFHIPPSPVPQNSTLRLIAKVTPEPSCESISWESPDGTSLKTVLKPHAGFVAKVPQLTHDDAGSYKCAVHTYGSDTVLTFAVNVAVDAVGVASFTRVQHGPTIFTATQARTSVPLTCPTVLGDCVFLYWRPPSSSNNKLVYHYDHWRGNTPSIESAKLQLAGSPYNADAGSFSFLYTPGLKDGGLYVCDVLVNDHIFSQRTLLSVLKVMGRRLGSELQLECLYSEISQVREAWWEYQNERCPPAMTTSSPGSVVAALPLPVTSDTAGNYTCTLRLKNGQTISAIHTVKQQESAVAPSSHSSSPLLLLLLALLLLVPLVAATVTVLLRQQKRISRRGIEQSLSVHSGETENIYENPEDVRQTLTQGSVYMDLKPRQDDVYKELER
ncbi:g6f-like [Hippocampus zosterae]|uniref:g6f-like n=1 Tax=Hippocampus zosterae TaxID=109293 RepID=UPI00223E11AC|nr:g6f-like [Hippocampus zosterae]